MLRAPVPVHAMPATDHPVIPLREVLLPVSPDVFQLHPPASPPHSLNEWLHLCFLWHMLSRLLRSAPGCSPGWLYTNLSASPDVPVCFSGTLIPALLILYHWYVQLPITV